MDLWCTVSGPTLPHTHTYTDLITHTPTHRAKYTQTFEESSLYTYLHIEHSYAYTDYMHAYANRVNHQEKVLYESSKEWPLRGPYYNNFKSVGLDMFEDWYLVKH